MTKEIILDTRELAPPEPMQQVMRLLANLPKGSYIHMIHRFRPTPMLEIVKNRGFSYRITEKSGQFNIYIWSSSDPEVARAIQEAQ